MSEGAHPAQSGTELAVTIADVESAAGRLRAFLSPTPLTFSTALSELFGHEVYLKWENRLRTGSFKERGALNMLLTLTPEERSRGVCAASAGNHALALSYYAHQLGIPCRIVMPIKAPLVKAETTRAHGAEVILIGETFNEAYDYACTLTNEQQLVFVPPFDHPLVVAGQGTAGLELIEQLPAFDTLVVPVGGGGLISGISLVVKQRMPQAHIIGVQSEWALSPPQHLGAISAIPPVTIADGIAVKRLGHVTAPIISRYVDRLIAASEVEVARSVMLLLEREHAVSEGAGAVGVTALLRNVVPPTTRRTVVVMSGSNIDANILSRLIERHMVECGRILRISISVPDAPGSLHTVTGMIAAQRANILQVDHDRSFSRLPGHVDVSFTLEVRNGAHQKEILSRLREAGLVVRRLE